MYILFFFHSLNTAICLRFFFCQSTDKKFRKCKWPKDLYSPDLRLTCFMISSFLNTPEYTNRLMLRQTFMNSPSISHPLLCCADKQCAVTVDCVGLGTDIRLPQAVSCWRKTTSFVWISSYVCSFCDIIIKLNFEACNSNRIWSNTS
jgi:hypothetical protein